MLVDDADKWISWVSSHWNHLPKTFTANPLDLRESKVKKRTQDHDLPYTRAFRAVNYPIHLVRKDLTGGSDRLYIIFVH